MFRPLFLDKKQVEQLRHLWLSNQVEASLKSDAISVRRLHNQPFSYISGKLQFLITLLPCRWQPRWSPYDALLIESSERITTDQFCGIKSGYPRT